MWFTLCLSVNDTFPSLSKDHLEQRPNHEASVKYVVHTLISITAYLPSQKDHREHRPNAKYEACQKCSLHFA